MRYKVRGVVTDGKPRVIGCWKQYSKTSKRVNGEIAWHKGWISHIRNIWDCWVDVIEGPHQSSSARFVALNIIEEDLRNNPRPPDYPKGIKVLNKLRPNFTQRKV